MDAFEEVKHLLELSLSASSGVGTLLYGYIIPAMKGIYGTRSNAQIHLENAITPMTIKTLRH